jgi:microsomal epoxide hydrolase
LEGSQRIGEKLLDSFDPEIPTATLLQWLTLYWLTQSFPTSIYLYRHLPAMGDFTVAPTASEKADFKKPMKGLKIEGKAMGYSTFPREIFPVPKAWAEKTGDLVFYRLNEKG